MEDVHGKEISLQYVTVKIPGQKPRGSKTVNTSSINESFVNFSISSKSSLQYITHLTITNDCKFFSSPNRLSVQRKTMLR